VVALVQGFVGKSADPTPSEAITDFHRRLKMEAFRALEE